MGIQDRVEKWKIQLLDLSGRNRAVYYKASRLSMPFAGTAETLWRALVEDGGFALQQADFVLESKDPERPEFHRRLRGLRDLARTFDEEQGVHVLYVAFGWLTWPDIVRSPTTEKEKPPGGQQTRVVISPLLFVPVKVDLKPVPRLSLVDVAPIDVNVSLEEAVNRTHGVRPRPLADDPDLRTTLKAWEEVVVGRHGWGVTIDAPTLDVFSFKKIALFKELDRLQNRIGDQQVLRAMCGEPASLPSGLGPSESLDEVLFKDSLSLVLPADSSQVRAVAEVARGRSLVIQGPPGTGKSQTITNLIANEVAHGKKVLFVAEKKQAREVVVGNLEDLGLRRIVLHISEGVVGRRSSADTKRDVIEQLAEALAQDAIQAEPIPLRPEYESAVNEANRYAKALSEPLRSSGLKLRDLLINAIRTRPSSHLRLEAASLAEELTPQVLERIRSTAFQVQDLGEEVLTDLDSSWLAAGFQTWSKQNAGEFEQQTSVFLNHCEGMATLARVPDGNTEWTLDEVAHTGARLRTAAEHVKVRKSFLGRLRSSYRKTKPAYETCISEGFAVANLADSALAIERALDEYLTSETYLKSHFPEFKSRPISNAVNFVRHLRAAQRHAESSLEVGAVIRSLPIESARRALLEVVTKRRPDVLIWDLFEASLYFSLADEFLVRRSELNLNEAQRSRLKGRLVEEAAREAVLAKGRVLTVAERNRPASGQPTPRGSEMHSLRSQMSAQRRRPLRWLFSRAPHLIQDLKPCIVASPLSVAQLLQSDQYQFDTVIFDEASQIPSADAIVPILHGTQVVVVGDTQQMPPTDFFDRALGVDDADDDDEFLADSILEEASAVLGSTKLLWHYRSRDESLIAFSNLNFYKGELLTFPSAWRSNAELGVKFHYLKDARYGRGGSRANSEEAEAAVKLLSEELARRPGITVGVTALSIAQSNEVQLRIEVAAESDDVLRQWLDDGGRARNLETIQGDEFDVSILSFGYGKDAVGNLQLNFGPLSRTDGYKRLNVAVTRAREKTIVLSSIRASDIDLRRVGAGGRFVRMYLDYAERGHVAILENLRAPNASVYDSPLEESVASRLRGLGWSLDTQIGVGGYRIDLAVHSPNDPYRYLCGIECDGATYHSSLTARDRDIGRQEVLSRLGWDLLRVWSTDWFRHEDRVVADVDARLRAMADEQVQALAADCGVGP